MTTSLKNPVCIMCNRGTKYNLAGGTETFVLIPTEICKNGLYQGIKWHIFCGSCIQPYLYNKNIDCSNLMTLIIQINIEGKGKKQTKRIEVLF